jgi:hypothetical protein
LGLVVPCGGAVRGVVLVVLVLVLVFLQRLSI